MTDLLPVAQAVLDAINKELDEAPWDVSFLAGVSAAAALRAAAAHLGSCNASEELIRIAIELEGHD